MQRLEVHNMASGRYHALPGGGESSDSDDTWDIGEFRDLGEKISKPSVIESKEEALKNALTTGNSDLVEELLDSGLNVDCLFQFGWTPLMYAANFANLKMVRVLLDRGANASFEKDGFTVLMTACSANTLEEDIVKCVDLLLSRNVDPNVCSREKMTALMLAAREGRTQVVALLVANGADINAQNESGFTGMALAAYYGHKNTVLKMLELGADIKLSTKNGDTPADIARQNNHLEIFSILSFSGNIKQGNCSLSKEEAIYRYLKVQPEPSVNSTCGFSASNDLDVFLHGLGLEHLTDLFKESDVTLRQLLSLEEFELKKIGVTDTEDYKKIVSAVKEIQVEEAKLEKLADISSLESSNELLAFLLNLNRQCSFMRQAVESVNNQIPLNAEKVVLELDSSQNFPSVCEDIVARVTELCNEVCRLQNLLNKFQQSQRNSPCRLPPLEEHQSYRWCKFLKMAAITGLSAGICISIAQVIRKK